MIGHTWKATLVPQRTTMITADGQRVELTDHSVRLYECEECGHGGQLHEFETV